MSTNQNTSDAIAFISMTLIVLMTLYLLWVRPYNQFLNQTMDCMTSIDDHSENGYNQCAQLVRNSQKGE